jgi:hypothetical protein
MGNYYPGPGGGATRALRRLGEQHPLAQYPAVRTICPMCFLLSCAYGGLVSPLLPVLRETFAVSYSTLGLLTPMCALSGMLIDGMATVLLQRRSLLSALWHSLVLTERGSIESPDKKPMKHPRFFGP